MTYDLERELRQHGASLHALAAALLSDSADAEDAVQDTWLTAIERPLPPVLPERDDALFGPFRVATGSGVTQKDIALHRVGAIRGRVLDPSGVPIASARVCVVREDDGDERGKPFEFDSRLAETVTNPAGAFFFRDLPSHAAIRLRVTDAAHPAHVTEPMQLIAGETTELDLQFQTSCTLVGQVIDEAHEPIAEVSVSVFRLGQEDSPLATAYSGSNGRFEFSAVPAGELFMKGTKDRYADVLLTLEPLAPGERTSDLTLRMLRASDLSGEVLDKSGAPVHRAVVYCQNMRDRTQIFESQTTDADGAFTWPQIPSGLYVLSVTLGEGEAQRRGGQAVPHPSDKPIKLVLN